jgi:phage minor structural protein
MLPLLYKTKSRTISTDSMEYIGRITDCESCLVTEVLNGDYLLTAEIKNSDSLYNNITVQEFIYVKANTMDAPQFFEIYEVVKNISGSTSIKAKHIKHCAYNNIMTAMLNNTTLMTPSEIWDAASDSPVFENNFIFESDITNKSSIFEVGFNKVGTFGEFFEELTEKFDGELYWDNFNVKFLKNRGEKKHYTLRFGQKISSLEQTLSTEDIKSHIIAVATVHDTYTDKDIQIIGTVYEIENQQSKTNKLLLLDATELVGDITVNSNTGYNYIAVENLCKFAAESHYKDSRPASIKTNITIDLRAELDEMKEISLADTIDVIIDPENSKVIAKVVKAEYDCLLERWNKLELGRIKTKLSDYF